MLDWWQRFERDCQTFERHLVHLEKQAETGSQPWPPQPTAETETQHEVEQSSRLGPSMELPEEAGYEPEPAVPEATAEI